MRKIRKRILRKRDVTEINKLLALGHKHYDNERFDSSYYYYSKAKYAAEIRKDTSRNIHSISWLSQTQRIQGDYAGIEATAVEALLLFC